ncbi:MAG: agmatine deiminase family protein [Bacteroidales bacterium]|nr:agmatine deiminase family protein [Bacteroidales bacterium]
MKKIVMTLMAVAVSMVALAQQQPTEEMQRQWRQMKQARTVGIDYKNSPIPLGEMAPAAKNAKALPEDRVWFPGEWEEVKAIVVTPYYSYSPDSNLGSGYYSADPAVTGYAEYYQFNSRVGWQSMGIYGPYISTMDTSSNFGKVFFYLMDGIQKGNAEAWVRVEQASDTAKVLRTLRRMNLRRDNVRFIVGPGNSFWYRDCGPICFYYGDEDSVAMMDFEYYPGRALDDSLPSLITRQMGVPNYINTFEWEGGNCLVDGAGFLFTSNQIYSANGDTYGQLTWDGHNISSLHYQTKSRLTQAQTRAALSSLLGQRETHILTAYQYDGGTGHVDLYADMCEENGFVFSVMPDQYSRWTDYQTGARNIDSLCSYTSIFNRPYYKTSIPFPSKDNGSNFSSQTEYDEDYTRTYSNHTFVNDLILQPCFSTVSNGQPSAAWDRANIEELKKAYPGYTIYPVDVREFDGSGGAIHCVTKQIPADNPVRILHKSIVGEANDMREQDIPVAAIITNRSGIAHAECIYRINEGEWDTVSLTANGNRFYGQLPTAAINERVMDTNYNSHLEIDSLLIRTDTITVIDTTLNDTSYNYVPVYQYDTTVVADTVIALRDTIVTVEYYLSATSNNGKTITKPMTAHQGGYYAFHYNGELEDAIDSIQYDFDTTPVPATDITFLFDANRTHLDDSGNGSDPVGIAQVEEAEEAFGQFYPNPATTRADIKVNMGNGGNYAVTVIDNMGRTLHTSHLQTAGRIVFSINTGKLASGIYTVVFSGNGQKVTRRLVVQ